MPNPDARPSVDTRYSRIAALADATLHAARALGALRLTPGEILRRAEDLTGLTDRDLAGIAAPLQHLCDDFAAHPPTDLGAAIVHETLVQGMVSRRRLQVAFDTSPMRPSRPPIVLVGWYRTGTTFLQQLLAALPGYDFVPMYRLAEPVPSVTGPPEREPVMRTLADLWSRTRAELGSVGMNVIAPELSALHPVQATGAEECWFLHLSHLAADGLRIAWRVPRYARWLDAHDRHPVYRTWARAAALLERDLGHGLVLKDPAHMGNLDALVAAMPEARLVWTHRPPARALASYGSLVATQRRIVYGAWDRYRVGDTVLDAAERNLRDGLDARSRLPDDAIFDVDQRELRADPVGVVERLADHHGLPFDARAVEDRARTLNAQPRRPHRHHLSHWGLDEAKIARRLAFYLDDPRTPRWTGST